MTDTNVEQPKLLNGTVLWFNPIKKFGFVARDDGGADCFVHAQAVENSGMPTLIAGQKVAFDLVADRKSNRLKVNHIEPVT